MEEGEKTEEKEETTSSRKPIMQKAPRFAARYIKN